MLLPRVCCFRFLVVGAFCKGCVGGFYFTVGFGMCFGL